MVLTFFATNTQTVIQTEGEITLLSGHADRGLHQSGIKHVLLERNARIPDLGFLVTELRHHGDVDHRSDLPAVHFRLTLHRDA